jgi:hypothetical protein
MPVDIAAAERFILAEIGALGDTMVPGAAAWLAAVAEPDGSVPFMLPTAAAHPHAPFLTPSPGGSFLTFALGRSSPTSRSRPTSSAWRAVSRRTAAGSSIGSLGRRSNLRTATAS